ncbi:hypothetical protein ABPG72_012672 [Tetrahymena utriculariae]
MYLEKSSVIVITGGSSGIGEALVKLFLERECMVIIVDKKEGNSPQLQYHYGSNKCQFYQCDVFDELQVSELFIKLMERHVRIDFLYNAAAINKFNDDPSLQPSAKMTRYACIMMTNQKGAKKDQPNQGVIVDLAQGSKQGVDDVSTNGMCPVYFRHGIRIINSPFCAFTDSITKQQQNDIVYSVFKLSISDQKFTEFLQLSPIGSPSL